MYIFSFNSNSYSYIYYKTYAEDFWVSCISAYKHVKLYAEMEATI